MFVCAWRGRGGGGRNGESVIKEHEKCRFLVFFFTGAKEKSKTTEREGEQAEKAQKNKEGLACLERERTLERMKNTEKNFIAAAAATP